MTVYISPSTKEYQISPITGTSEAESMRLLAEGVQKNLVDLGIGARISNSTFTPIQSADDSNKEPHALHLVLSSLRATSPEERGIKIYFQSTDGKSRDYAVTIAENLKEIYPLPKNISTEPSNSLVELIKTASPAVVVSIGNQSNEEDVKWFNDSLGDIAQNIAFSIGDVLGVKNESSPITAIGIISSPKGYAEIRKTPSPTAKIITRLPNGTPIRIIGLIGNWYAVIAANSEGYVLESDVSAETPER